MDSTGAILAGASFPTRSIFTPRARENLSVAMYSIPGKIDSGTRFRRGAPGEGYVRLALTVPKERMAEALARLARLG